MAFPPGYLFQSSLSLYSSGGISGPRTRDLGRSSGGSAFAPYASTAFSHTAALNSIPFSSENAIPFPSYVGSYDHTPAVSGSVCYHPYGSLGPYPFGDPAYRKNTARDATATLKAWLSEHRKNPYPTKGEKIMLAIITKMTLTQVSTWFANARRRLKKENKMSWTPRNRSEDEDDEDSIDLEKNDEDEEPLKSNQTSDVTKHSVVEDSLEKHTEDDPTSHVLIQSEEHENRTVPDLMASTSSPQNDIREGPRPPGENCTPTSVIHSVNPTPKPKLWSLAEMATSDKRCEEASPERFSPAGSPELCPYPPKHLFYTSAFRPGFTNYNAFGSLHESIPKHLNGIKQTVLNRDSRLPL